MNPALRRFLHSLPGIVIATLAILLALGLALASSAASHRSNWYASAIMAGASLILAALISVTVVPELARGVGLRYLRNLRLFTLTRVGLFFLLLILILSLASVSTGNNLLTVVLSLLLSSILVSGVFSNVILSDINVSLNLPDRIFAGEPTRFILSLQNEKHYFPVISVLLGGYRAAQATAGALLQSRAYFPFVAPRQSQSYAIQTEFGRRGRYDLAGFKAQTGFPFGFFDKAREIPAEGDIVVFPRRVDVRSEFHLFPFLRGFQEGMRRGFGDSLYTIRPYDARDDARFIHWKASAKLDRMMVKEFIEEEERRVCVCLDNSAKQGRVTRNQFERAVELAASLCIHFVEEGSGVQLLLCEERIDFGTGRAHLTEVLGKLATVEPNGSRDSFHKKLEQEGHSVRGDELFKIVFSTQPAGATPPGIWRTSHVIHMDQL